MGAGLTNLTSRLPGCLRHVAGGGVVRKRLARGDVHILHAPKPCTVLVRSAATTGLKHGRRNSCVGAAHRVELVRPIEASVARWARRVAIRAALGVHEVHASPMALRWREPLMAARGRGWARRVPERVLSGRWIAARLPAVRLRRAGEQVADEHGLASPPRTRARRERIPKPESTRRLGDAYTCTHFQSSRPQHSLGFCSLTARSFFTSALSRVRCAPAPPLLRTQRGGVALRARHRLSTAARWCSRRRGSPSCAPRPARSRSTRVRRARRRARRTRNPPRAARRRRGRSWR